MEPKANTRRVFLSIFELGSDPSCSNSEKKITYIWQLVILRENQQEFLATKKKQYQSNTYLLSQKTLHRFE